jgi:Pro-kumamolisin, activation domain/Bacterial Ig-like domain (group 3)
MSKACAVFLALSLCAFLPSEGQTSRKPVITGPVDSGTTVVLAGSKHQLVQPRFDVGAVDPGLKMTRVILALSTTQEAQAGLQTLLDHQQDRTSPDYHHWLTPEEFGQKFGPAPQDILTIQGWLEQQGLQVTAVAKSGLWMEFSGTSAQIERAFQTQMRQYQVSGEMHIANASELSIPAALAPVVQGVVSLHNFFKKPLIGRHSQARSNGDGTYTPISSDATLTGSNGPIHALTPGDYANIYDLNPLYQATPTALNGAGVQIGLVARSDISANDFTGFRILTNLSPSNVTNVLTQPPDPGFDPTSGDALEATLDAEWSGGVAQGANIQVIVSASTITTDGVDLSSAYAVDHNLTDILSVSFGECELGLGTSENQFFNSLWQQAAAQGMSVFVSSGDNGAAGCDPTHSATAAVHGLAVSGLASTPFNTAVGGTQFSDPTPATFWSATNGTGGVSVNGYIPETVWNETCDPNTVGSPCAGQGFFLDAGSGGKSTVYPKPAWQAGFPAAPADTSRDIPDVSLSAAGHDGYIVCFNSSCAQSLVHVVGGTSASSPAFAGIMAIVDQVLGGRQGLANYTLYRLARNASASCSSSARTVPSVPAPAACIFNDVTTGNNSVPGLTGFSAVSGFDLATGLGSVNAANLISAWRSLTGAATTTTLSSTLGGTVSAAHGAGVPLTINVTNPNTPAPSGAVALLSTLNSSTSIGSVVLTPSSSTTGTFNGNVFDLPGGTYTISAHYAGDSVTAPSSSAPLSVTITPEPSTTAIRAFQVSSSNVPVSPSNSFAYGDTIFLLANVIPVSTHGVPTGSISFVDTSAVPQINLASTALNFEGEAHVLISANGFGSLQALGLGTHVIKSTYAGDTSFTPGTQGSVTLTIGKGNPKITVGSSTFIAGLPGSISAGVHTAGVITPTGTVQFLDGGIPLGAPVTLDASGGAVVHTTFQNEGTHSFSVSYSGDATYNAEVSAPTAGAVFAPFQMLAGGSQNLSATVPAGQTAFYNISITDASSDPANPNNFSGTVTFSCSGLPAGSTCSFNPPSIALTPNQSFPFTVSVTTSASAALHPAFPFRGLPVVFAGVLALAVSLKGTRKHLWQVGLVAVLAFGISSCGGGGNKTITTPVLPPTQGPTNATIVVTGTSGTHTSTINLSLTITH